MTNEFKGYWSDRDKSIWEGINWAERDYKDFPVEEDTFEGTGTFYSVNGTESKKITFVKYLRANPIYPPYYGPIYTADLLDFMKKGHYCYPMYDGNTEGHYDIHDRFEDSNTADILSR